MTYIPNEKRAKLRFRMSKQQKLDPKKNSDQIYKGSHLMFLTPDRKLPPLKTTFTRPQNVSLADLSPFYRQTRNPLLQDSAYSPLTSPILSEVSKSNTDAKSGNCDEEYEHDTKNDTGSFDGKVGLETPFERHLKETYVGVTKTHDKQKENSETVKSYASNTLNEKHTLDLNNESFKKMDIVGIEMQIIPENEVDVEKSPLSLSDFTSHSNVGEDRFQSKLCEPESSERQHGHNSYSGNQTSRNIDSGEGRRRRYTPSFCSSCSCEDSMIAQSRCSVCDGCSTSTCNSSYSSIEPSHARPSGESVENYFHPFEMSATKIDHLLDSHLSFEELDVGLLKSLSEEVNESKAKGNPCVGFYFPFF
ncbi:uncharacterized protein LOC132759236 [Ruditapes philippinarum]|uniref:uncharacterized protein LOC132759236 n=1 Tax=Ruditapes philippinarum TaxID=129788 RepID=UPI00295AE760|nr:uncharacterized protein LOC132759236 [Ruditapes philippinarum]